MTFILKEKLIYIFIGHAKKTRVSFLGLILAIDDLSTKKAIKILSDVCDYVDGVKIGISFLIKNGLSNLESLRTVCNKKLWIADLKLADIGYVMVRTTDLIANFFDAIIAHSFVGVKDGLDELAGYCSKNKLKLILVATMSHEGAKEIYDFALIRLRDIVTRINPWGLVAPATRPEIIHFLRKILGSKIKILSPGIGPQGALPGEALCAGSNYEIVGRLITKSDSPLKSVQEIVSAQEKKLEKCRINIKQ